MYLIYGDCVKKKKKTVIQPIKQKNKIKDKKIESRKSDLEEREFRPFLFFFPIVRTLGWLLREGSMIQSIWLFCATPRPNSLFFSFPNYLTNGYIHT